MECVFCSFASTVSRPLSSRASNTKKGRELAVGCGLIDDLFHFIPGHIPLLLSDFYPRIRI
jgi:hypothetical protein